MLLYVVCGWRCCPHTDKRRISSKQGFAQDSRLDRDLSYCQRSFSTSLSLSCAALRHLTFWTRPRQCRRQDDCVIAAYDEQDSFKRDAEDEKVPHIQLFLIRSRARAEILGDDCTGLYRWRFPEMPHQPTDPRRGCLEVHHIQKLYPKKSQWIIIMCCTSRHPLHWSFGWCGQWKRHLQKPIQSSPSISARLAWDLIRKTVSRRRGWACATRKRRRAQRQGLWSNVNGR